MKPQRLFTLMLAFLLVGVLAGCSKEEPPPPNMAATSAFVPTKSKKHKSAVAKGSTDASAGKTGGKSADKNPDKSGKAPDPAATAADNLNQANKLCRQETENRVHGNLAALFGFRKPDPNAVYFDCMKDKGFEVKQ